MNSKELRAIFDNSSKLSKTVEIYNGFQTVGSIPFLLKVLESNVSEEIRYILYIELTARSRGSPLQMMFFRRMVNDLPFHIQAILCLAYALTQRTNNPNEVRDEVTQLGRRAFELAKSKKEWIKYAGVNIARNALWLEDYATLEYILQELIDDATNDWPEDHIYEFDFVDKIDLLRLHNPQLVKRYLGLRNQRYLASDA